jgi:ADP-ribose pyrophosphatase
VSGGPETVIASRYGYRGKVLNLRIDDVRLPDGRTAVREVAEHRPAVCVVALDAEDNVLLVRQYRLPAGEAMLEIPAGSANPDEEPAAAARRELAEETGYVPGQIEPLGGFYSAPGFLTEYLHLFLATDLREEPGQADEDEDVELVRVPAAEAIARAARGEYRDAKTLIGLLMLGARRAGQASR